MKAFLFSLLILCAISTGVFAQSHQSETTTPSANLSVISLTAIGDIQTPTQVTLRPVSNEVLDELAPDIVNLMGACGLACWEEFRLCAIDCNYDNTCRQQCAAERMACLSGCP